MNIFKNAFCAYLCFLIIGASVCSQVAQEGSCSPVDNHEAGVDKQRLHIPQGQRAPKGFWISPYSFLPTARLGLNYFTGGAWSYQNPDLQGREPSPLHGVCSMGSNPAKRPYKFLFVGDLMVDAFGKFPELSADVQKLFKSVDVVVVNVEAPVVDVTSKGGTSAALQFEMESSYLKALYDQNPDAQWIFGIANNHACDTSGESSTDRAGIMATTHAIKKSMPQAYVLGTDAGEGQSVVTIEVPDGPKVGIVAWTELMNRDGINFEKPIVRDSDVTPASIKNLKQEGVFDLLFGFMHGNEEQSYEPLKETRDTLVGLTGSDVFNVIVGHGPHVVHPVEKVSHSDTTESFIAHSLGNLCGRNPTRGPGQTKVGALLELTVLKGPQTKVKHRVHFSQQAPDGKTSLLEDDLSDCIYPAVAERLGRFYKK